MSNVYFTGGSKLAKFARRKGLVPMVKKILKDKQQDRRIAKLSKSVSSQIRVAARYDSDDTTIGGSTYPLCLLAVGDDNGFRDGTAIRIWKVDIFGYIFNNDNGAANESTNVCRLLLTSHKINGGAVTPLNAILQDVASGPRAVNSSRNFVNVSQDKAIRVYRDRRITSKKESPNTADDFQLPAKTFKLSKTFKGGLKVGYNANTAVIGAVQNGLLQLSHISNNTTMHVEIWSMIYYTP